MIDKKGPIFFFSCLDIQRAIQKNLRWAVLVTVLAAMMLPGRLVSAGEMGEITAYSVVGEPLDIGIDLSAVSDKALSKLNAELASEEEYERLGLEYPRNIGDVRVSIEISERAKPQIRVRSRLPVQSEVLPLILHLESEHGKEQKEYTVSLASANRKPVEGPKVLTAQHGDSLSMLMDSRLPEGVSRFQAWLAVYDANPDAFENGDVNVLISGSRLTVPDRDKMLEVSAAAAKLRMAALMNAEEPSSGLAAPGHDELTAAKRQPEKATVRVFSDAGTKSETGTETGVDTPKALATDTATAAADAAEKADGPADQKATDLADKAEPEAAQTRDEEMAEVPSPEQVQDRQSAGPDVVDALSTFEERLNQIASTAQQSQESDEQLERRLMQLETRINQIERRIVARIEKVVREIPREVASAADNKDEILVASAVAATNAANSGMASASERPPEAGKSPERNEADSPDVSRIEKLNNEEKSKQHEALDENGSQHASDESPAAGDAVMSADQTAQIGDTQASESPFASVDSTLPQFETQPVQVMPAQPSLFEGWPERWSESWPEWASYFPFLKPMLAGLAALLVGLWLWRRISAGRQDTGDERGDSAQEASPETSEDTLLASEGHDESLSGFVSTEADEDSDLTGIVIDSTMVEEGDSMDIEGSSYLASTEFDIEQETGHRILDDPDSQVDSQADSVADMDAIAGKDSGGLFGDSALDADDFGEPDTESKLSEFRSTTVDASNLHIDPLAEADVYLAYDRPNHAAQILQRAYQHSPERSVLALKLLKIYGDMGNQTAFESVVGQLQESKQLDDPGLSEKVAAMREAMETGTSPEGSQAFTDPSETPRFGGQRSAWHENLSADDFEEKDDDILWRGVTPSSFAAGSAAQAEDDPSIPSFELDDLESEQEAWFTQEVELPASPSFLGTDSELDALEERMESGLDSLTHIVSETAEAVPEGAQALKLEGASEGEGREQPTQTGAQSSMPDAGQGEPARKPAPSITLTEDLELGKSVELGSDQEVAGMSGAQYPELSVHSTLFTDQLENSEYGGDSSNDSESAVRVAPLHRSQVRVEPRFSQDDWPDVSGTGMGTEPLVTERSETVFSGLEVDSKLLDSDVGEVERPSSYDSDRSQAGMEDEEDSTQSDMAPHEPATSLALAKAYIELGEIEIARDFLQDASRDGSGEVQEEAKQLLEELS